MKYLITGGTGQLGHDIVKELISRGGLNYLAPTTKEMNITNKDEVEKVILGYKPDIIFHCAAYTAVDKAEEDRENCYNVNVNGTKNIVSVAEKINAKVVYISTDYVFDGTKKTEYETEDITNPINYYGYTKLLGEEVVKKLKDYLIVRISWVFGENGKNFVKTMLNLAETKTELSIVSDQIGSPTYTKDLSKLLLDMIENNKKGLFFATNEDFCSWYEFAEYIFKINNINIKLNKILTKDYKTLAKRPLNSKLSKNKLDEEGLTRLPSWQDAASRFCKVLMKEK
ncbi:MAG: dTDP-4-dehydrorhamnose reductase [Firmicutes bacterium CAG:321_26_22]|nr:MAG: dTDP-4-dehydrorhamnose reductase [Firmicutes bacterium CAG:321_26_22]